MATALCSIDCLLRTCACLLARSEALVKSLLPHELILVHRWIHWIKREGLRLVWEAHTWRHCRRVGRDRHHRWWHVSRSHHAILVHFLMVCHHLLHLVLGKVRDAAWNALQIEVWQVSIDRVHLALGTSSLLTVASIPLYHLVIIIVKVSIVDVLRIDKVLVLVSIGLLRCLSSLFLFLFYVA